MIIEAWCCSRIWSTFTVVISIWCCLTCYCFWVNECVDNALHLTLLLLAIIVWVSITLYFDSDIHWRWIKLTIMLILVIFYFIIIISSLISYLNVPLLEHINCCLEWCGLSSTCIYVAPCCSLWQDNKDDTIRLRRTPTARFAWLSLASSAYLTKHCTTSPSSRPNFWCHLYLVTYPWTRFILYNMLVAEHCFRFVFFSTTNIFDIYSKTLWIIIYCFWMTSYFLTVSVEQNVNLQGSPENSTKSMAP